MASLGAAIAAAVAMAMVSVAPVVAFADDAAGTPPAPKQTGTVSVSGNMRFSSMSYDGSVAMMHEADSEDGGDAVVSFKDRKVTPIAGQGMITPDAKFVFFIDAASKGLKMLDVATGKVSDLPGDVAGMELAGATGDRVLLSRDDSVVVYDVAAQRLRTTTDFSNTAPSDTFNIRIPSTDLSRMFIIDDYVSTSPKLLTYDLDTGKQTDAKTISGMPSDAEMSTLQADSLTTNDKAVVVSTYMASAQSVAPRVFRLGLDDAKMTPLADGAYMTGESNFFSGNVNPAIPAVPYVLVVPGADGEFNSDPIPADAKSVQVFDVAANKVVRTVKLPAALREQGNIFLGLSDDGNFALNYKLEDPLKWQTVDLATGNVASVQLDLAGDFAETEDSDCWVSWDGSMFVTAKWDSSTNATTVKVYATGVGGTVKPEPSGRAWTVALPMLGRISVWWVIGAAAGLVVLIAAIVIIVMLAHRRRARKALQDQPVPPAQPAAPLVPQVQPAQSPDQPLAPAVPTFPAGPVPQATVPVAPPASPVAPTDIVSPGSPAPATVLPPAVNAPASPAASVPVASAVPAPAPDVRFCTQCGARITSAKARFCPNCGSALEG